MAVEWEANVDGVSTRPPRQSTPEPLKESRSLHWLSHSVAGISLAVHSKTVVRLCTFYLFLFISVCHQLIDPHNSFFPRPVPIWPCSRPEYNTISTAEKFLSGKLIQLSVRWLSCATACHALASTISILCRLEPVLTFNESLRLSKLSSESLVFIWPFLLRCACATPCVCRQLKGTHGVVLAVLRVCELKLDLPAPPFLLTSQAQENVGWKKSKKTLGTTRVQQHFFAWASQCWKSRRSQWLVGTAAVVDRIPNDLLNISGRRTSICAVLFLWYSFSYFCSFVR